MRCIALRSRNGCQRCRAKKRKCDERKPICGRCLHLGCACKWTGSSSSSGNWGDGDLSAAGTPNLALSTSRSASEVSDDGSAIQHYDLAASGPSASLSTGIISVVKDATGRHVLEYLFGRGHLILRYPAKGIPASASVNSFSSGFAMALSSPVQIQAYQCLGAGYFSKINPEYESLALKYYDRVMASFRTQLYSQADSDINFPGEWTCAVAAILSRYEMIVSNTSRSRLAHLRGFHHLVETRVKKNLPWGRLRMLLEHYLHSLSDNSLFHAADMVSDKGVNHADRILQVLNSRLRPLGREIVGVPEELTTSVYRLSYLLVNDRTSPGWHFEMALTSARIDAWQPDMSELRFVKPLLNLIGMLYQLACRCLCEYIYTRNGDLESSLFNELVTKACSLIQGSDITIKPSNSVAWPLTVLGVFARTQEQRDYMKRPLEALVNIAMLDGYRSALLFLQYVWKHDLGPKVFEDAEALSIVHI